MFNENSRNIQIKRVHEIIDVKSLNDTEQFLTRIIATSNDTVHRITLPLPTSSISFAEIKKKII